MEIFHKEAYASGADLIRRSMQDARFAIMPDRVAEETSDRALEKF